jgi:hypothetical protein
MKCRCAASVRSESRRVGSSRHLDLRRRECLKQIDRQPLAGLPELLADDGAGRGIQFT